MSDGIIDLTAYMRERDEGGDPPARGAFALWGADGERSRFALPLWRVIYLAGGGRGGIVWRRAGRPPLTPFVVLDLEKDPPRRDFPDSMADPLAASEAPTLQDLGGDQGVVVFLGVHDDRRWYLMVRDGAPREPLRARDREDILFLAGECAGLLFLREFADHADELDDE